jgi:hypothetical protein
MGLKANVARNSILAKREEFPSGGTLLLVKDLTVVPGQKILRLGEYFYYAYSLFICILEIWVELLTSGGA